MSFRVSRELPAETDAVRIANEVIGDSGMAVAVVLSSTAGASAAGDLTSMALLASTGCSGPSIASAGGNSRLISPLPLYGGSAGMLLGNLTVVLVFGLLHMGSTRALRRIRAKKVATNDVDVFALAKFPALTATVMTLLFQGTLFLTVRIFAGVSSNGGVDYFVAVLGLVFSLCVPTLLMRYSSMTISATFTAYRYDRQSSESDKVATLWRWLLPRGRWEPLAMRQRFGLLLAPYGRPEPWWFLAMSFSPTVIAIAAAPNATNGADCLGQFLMIVILQVLYTGMLVVTRPYRSVFANVTAVMSSSSLLLVALGGLLRVKYPTQKFPFDIAVTAIMLQAIFAALRLAYSAFCVVFENRILKKVPTAVETRRPYGMTAAIIDSMTLRDEDGGAVIDEPLLQTAKTMDDVENGQQPDGKDDTPEAAASTKAGKEVAVDPRRAVEGDVEMDALFGTPADVATATSTSTQKYNDMGSGSSACHSLHVASVVNGAPGDELDANPLIDYRGHGRAQISSSSPQSRAPTAKSLETEIEFDDLL